MAPITHSPPHDPTVAIEMLPKVKAHLGLDGERSWLILDDVNEFAPSVPCPGKPGRYGFPLAPYRAIVERILELRRHDRVFLSSRDE